MKYTMKKTAATPDSKPAKARTRPVRRASVRGQPENKIASMPKRKTK
jgi:hypothetical protein